MYLSEISNPFHIYLFYFTGYNFNRGIDFCQYYLSWDLFVVLKYFSLYNKTCSGKI